MNRLEEKNEEPFKGRTFCSHRSGFDRYSILRVLFILLVSLPIIVFSFYLIFLTMDLEFLPEIVSRAILTMLLLFSLIGAPIVAVNLARKLFNEPSRWRLLFKDSNTFLVQSPDGVKQEFNLQLCESIKLSHRHLEFNYKLASYQLPRVWVAGSYTLSPPQNSESFLTEMNISSDIYFFSHSIGSLQLVFRSLGKYMRPYAVTLAEPETIVWPNGCF